VVRLLKAVGRSRPPAPRYNSTWDVDLVLSLFQSWQTNDQLSLKFLTLKLAGLLALISAQRVQTLHSITISSMQIQLDKVEIYISAQTKTSKPGYKQPCIVLMKYPHDPKLCVVSALAEYMSRTSSYRKHDQLFLSLELPHNNVNKETISRWLKMLLAEAKIDTTIYKAHSFRHASTSKAFGRGIATDVIFSAAGWSSKSATFARYYNKKIEVKNVYSNAILNQVNIQ